MILLEALFIIGAIIAFVGLPLLILLMLAEMIFGFWNRY